MTFHISAVALTIAILTAYVSSSGPDCVQRCTDMFDEYICVTEDMRCDNFPDCKDLEDEENCGCQGFRCKNGDCIKSNQRCNGVDECLDLSDERNCTRSEYSGKPHNDNGNPEGCLMPCVFGKCKFDHHDVASCVCNAGFVGDFCEQSAHAQSLKPSSTSDASDDNEFLCGASVSLPQKIVCDGKIDCAEDQKDELNCTRKDYQRSTHPDLTPNEADCLMPCGPGTCAFAEEEGPAKCKCPDTLTGHFCEKVKEFVVSGGVQANGSSPTTILALPEASEGEGFTSMVVVPVMAVGLAAMVIWLLMTKPWSNSAGSSQIV